MSQVKSPQEGILVVGARENNLKNIQVFIPRNKLTVITGLSGSGKSTLAFDTIYAEGQRRYMESLSNYARYFIDQMKRPAVDVIHGLSPSIAIHQKTTSTNPRSTVGTLTEIYDYVRLLYARLGQAFCPTHKQALEEQSSEEIVGDILANSPKNHPLFVFAPIARGKKGEFLKEFEKYRKLGFDKARVDGEWVDLSKAKKLAKKKDHYIDILIQKLPVEKKYYKEFHQAVETALSFSEGYVLVENQKKYKKIYSLHLACSKCQYTFSDLEPRLFSFNSPKGACDDCGGTGLVYFEEKEEETDKDVVFEEVCPTCEGSRLKDFVLEVKIAGKNISEVSSLTVEDLCAWLKSLKFTSSKAKIFKKISQVIYFHVDFLKELGVSYLSLNRSLVTLSGGEVQRLRLVSQLSSPLIGILYVLDEPSIGLHARDHIRILKVLKKIRDRGNTIILVEHDEESICYADKIIDLGPGAGVNGGYVQAEGSLAQIKKNKKSLTGAYISGRISIPLSQSLWTGKEPCLELSGISKNNLKNIKVKLPLGRLVGVSGVSGSGKSSMVIDTIYPCLEYHLQNLEIPEDMCKSVKGLDHVDRVVQINQKPIGRTPRSTPATYIQVFQLIRSFFALLPESRLRGFQPGHFSFNVQGGRCENCSGAGALKLEMRFLPDVWVKCDICEGKRFQPEILEVRYKGKNISEVLSMSVGEALPFFKEHPGIYHKLKFLNDVGLSYITLGQSATTLSGGEAQRLKISRELSKKSKGHTFYILDEPTTGLHFQDVGLLIDIMKKLRDQDNTVLVIEHNLEILKSCDYLFDLGPEGGAKGGRIIAQGPPSHVVKKARSLTGKYLAKVLNKKDK